MAVSGRAWLACLVVAPVIAIGCGDPDDGKDDAVADSGADQQASETDATDDAADAASDVVADSFGLDAGGSDASAVGDVGSDALSDAVSPTDANSGALADAVVDATVDSAANVDAGDTASCETYQLDPKVCFSVKPPGPDAVVADVPPPNTSPCKYPESNIVTSLLGGKVPKSTIDVQLGFINSGGGFVPFTDKGWAKLTPGLQPGFHIWAAVRLVIAGHPASKDKLKAKTIVDVTAWDGCTFSGLNYSKVIYPKPKGAAYVYGDKIVPGLQIRFKKPTGHDLPKHHLWDVCGRWIDIRADMYNTATKAFGRKWLRLRTYAEQPGDYKACK